MFARRRPTIGLILLGTVLVAPIGAREPSNSSPRRPARDRQTDSTDVGEGGQPGANVTVQLPTFGVAVDADGLLTVKTVEDPGGQLRLARLAAAKAGLPGNVLARSKLRKVSLVRLERAVRRCLDAGDQPDDVMRHLAGLERVQFVFCNPETRDIVVAGPAEGWIDDGVGRAVGVTSGWPQMLLEDLVVALRAFRPGAPRGMFVGCTIDPPAQGLARWQRFQQTVPHVVPEEQRAAVADEITRGIAESLGLAEIRVFGIPADTHLAAVLVEADYRMKLIGIGLERPPVSIVSFLDAAGGQKTAHLQRWWFTPDYDCLKVSDDRLAMEMLGQGVQLQAEDKVIGPQGRLLGGLPASAASRRFTGSFTRHYPQLAARSPVFAQLRQSIDLLVMAAFLRRQDYYGRAGWKMETLDNETLLATETLPTPRHVACVVNAQWKGARLVTPAGGGVSIAADEALDPKRLQTDKDGALARHRDDVARPQGDDVWWWD